MGTKHHTICIGPKDRSFHDLFMQRYLTFSNSQTVWQCQNVLDVGRTVHLSLFS